MLHANKLGRACLLAFFLIGLCSFARPAAAGHGCTNTSDGLVSSCALTTLTNVQAMRANDFLNMLGANANAATTQAKANVAISQLTYAGLRNIRGSAGSGGTTIPASVFTSACKAGIRVSILANIDTYAVSGAQGVADQVLSYVKAINTLMPGCVGMVEGVNEPDDNTITGATPAQGRATGDLIQKAIWNTVKPAYPNVKIAAWSPGNSYYPHLDKFLRANITPYADYCTLHDYFGSTWRTGQTFIGSSLDEFNSCTRDVVVGKQVVATEFGNMVGLAQLNQDAQAKLIMNKFLDHAQLGMPISDVFILQGVTAARDYGLFDQNGNPREIAVALHNMTSLLNDTGTNAATFTPMTLSTLPSYMLSGLSLLTAEGAPTGHFLMLQKSDGSMWLLLWNEADVWNYVTHSETNDAPATVTVHFPTTVSGDVYDPFGCKETQLVCNPSTGATPVTAFSNLSQIAVSLTDHLIMIKLNL